MAELVIDAKLDNLDKVQAFIEETLEEAGCSPKAMMQISIAVEEIFVNIASYAYPDGGGKARLEATILDGSERGVSLLFADSGVPFDPMAKEDPDVTLPAEERGIGGLGIYMVKKSMDDMYYKREDGENRLTIVKKW